MTTGVWFAPHYSTKALENMAEVRACFPSNKADTLNWLFCSTSGVHGMYTTIDEAEAKALNPTPPDEDGEQFPPSITVLIVQPRIVHMKYGHFDVTPDDLAWLRMMVGSTLEAVALSQAGNLPPQPSQDAEVSQ